MDGKVVAITGASRGIGAAAARAFAAAGARVAVLARSADEITAPAQIMGLSAGTVATGVQAKNRASGINPVFALDPSVHIPADWPARALVWMCGPGGDAHLGEEFKLRDAWLCTAIGVAE